MTISASRRARGIFLSMSHALSFLLPAPPAGQVYEVWMIEGETPIPGPCLSPAADGSLVAFIDAELATTDVMAVTVEPETCSTAPTTTPVFVADLTTA